MAEKVKETSNLSIERFFAQNQVKKNTEKVYVTDSFVDDNGDPIPWEIRALTYDEHERILNSPSVTIQEKDRRTGNITYRTKETEYVAALCAQAVVFPDLGNRELQLSFQEANGRSKRISSKVELIKVMLTVGELSNLAEKVTEISDLGDSIENDIEDVKN